MTERIRGINSPVTHKGVWHFVTANPWAEAMEFAEFRGMPKNARTVGSMRGTPKHLRHAVVLILPKRGGGECFAGDNPCTRDWFDDEESRPEREREHASRRAAAVAIREKMAARRLA